MIHNTAESANMISYTSAWRRGQKYCVGIVAQHVFRAGRWHVQSGAKKHAALCDAQLSSGIHFPTILWMLEVHMSSYEFIWALLCTLTRASLLATVRGRTLHRMVSSAVAVFIYSYTTQAETRVFWVYTLGREIPPLGNRGFF